MSAWPIAGIWAAAAFGLVVSALGLARATPRLPLLIFGGAPPARALQAFCAPLSPKRREPLLALGLLGLGWGALALGLITLEGGVGHALAFALLCQVLLAAAICDARAFLLPDALVLPVALLGLALLALHPIPGVGWREAALGAAAAGGVLWSLRALFGWLRGVEALGLGDVKLGMALGLWMGWSGAPYFLMIGAVIALLYAAGQAALSGSGLKRDSIAPLGVGLCPAGALLAYYTLWRGPVL